MVVAGGWLTAANSLTIAQLVLPDWVRARGMSIYQMALMGSCGRGTTGQVARGPRAHELDGRIGAVVCVHQRPSRGAVRSRT
jgi:hypothetical protein